MRIYAESNSKLASCEKMYKNKPIEMNLEQAYDILKKTVYRTAVRAADFEPLVDEIPGLIRKETHSLQDTMKIVADRYQDVMQHKDPCSPCVTRVRYIPVSVDYVFDYLIQIQSLEEFTVSLRDFRPCPSRKGLWLGQEHFCPGAAISIKVVANREAGCIDHLCTWDNSENLGIYYAFRLYDGEHIMGQPGTVVQWTSFKHKNHGENDPLMELFKVSPQFDQVRNIELDNLTCILEARFRCRYGYLMDETLSGWV